MARPKQVNKQTERVIQGKAYYVFSTLNNDNEYVDWKASPSGIPQRGMSVMIKGGAGIANDRIITPLGVRTSITEEEAGMLQSHEMFNMHKDNGFVVLIEDALEVEAVVADMNGKDHSSPLTPSTFEGLTEDDGVALPTEEFR